MDADTTLASQASAAASQVGTDNPSSVEQGSPAEDSAVQEHRDWTELDIEEIFEKHPKLRELDPESLISRHPGLKSHVARSTKSQADKAVYRALQEKDREYQSHLQQLDAQKQEEAFDNFLNTADETQIAEWVKSDRKRRKELAPVIDYVRRSGEQDGYTKGQLAELRNVTATFEEIFPHWKAMSVEQRQEYVSRFQEPREFVVELVRDGLSRAVEEDRKQAKAKTEKEASIEARSKEPNPDLGGGSAPDTSGQMSQAEFDRNRADPVWRTKNLKRMQEAFAAGRIRR